MKYLIVFALSLLPAASMAVETSADELIFRAQREFKGRLGMEIKNPNVIVQKHADGLVLLVTGFVPQHWVAFYQVFDHNRPDRPAASSIGLLTEGTTSNKATVYKVHSPKALTVLSAVSRSEFFRGNILENNFEDILSRNSSLHFLGPAEASLRLKPRSVINVTWTAGRWSAWVTPARICQILF